VVLTIVPEAVCDTTLEKINQEQRSKEEKSTNGNEGELEIIKCFQRSKQKLFNYFPLSQKGLKIPKPCAHVQKVQSAITEIWRINLLT
jgi:hypothetical protein